jgi:Zn-dependent protease with chaperone function
MAVQGRYYDGHTSRPRAVALSATEGRLEVKGEDIEFTVPLEEVRLSERLGGAPRRMDFPGGPHCEVADDDALAEFLADNGYRETAVARWQHSWRHTLAALLLTVAALGAGYRWGLPWLADEAARQLPAAAVQKLEDYALSTLDDALFHPSKLPPARQAEIIQRFDRMVPPDGNPVPHRILFRDGGTFLGANAIAFPAGTIVVTDQLVAIAGSDEEILGVLAHEQGHVRERHSVRQILQSSAVGAVVTLFIGDVSSLLAAVPSVLLEAKYSRDFERSADRYAATLLKANGLEPALLADMLERIEASHRSAAAKGDEASASDYFASHPATPERIRTLRGQP